MVVKAMADTVFDKVRKLIRKAEKETCSQVRVPIELLKEILVSSDVERRWIPVSERLPDEYTNVLVMSKRFEEPKIDQIWIVRGDKIWTLDNVTHWMPLPKPPKKDGDGE